MNVNKILLGSTEKNRKADRGNDFNDYCQIPITNTCRVLVLDPTDFTVLLYLCFSKPFTRRSPYRILLERTAYHRDPRD